MGKVIKTLLITGSEGFIGKNLSKDFEFGNKYKLIFFNKKDKLEQLEELINCSDFLIHLAGVNRPKKETFFKLHNSDLTEHICHLINKKNENYIER